MGAYITRWMSKKLQGEDEATLRSGEAESSIGMAQKEAEDDGNLILTHYYASRYPKLFILLYFYHEFMTHIVQRNVQ
jgi:hypothetical protein